MIPNANSALQFKRRFRFFYPHSRLKAEVSDNDGASWVQIYEAAGTSTGSSADWENTWKTISEPIPEAYHGRPLRLRFRIVPLGTSYFPWPPPSGPDQPAENFGVFLDDITITNTSQILSEQLTFLEPDAESFALDSSTVGDALSVESDYLIQLAPIVGGHQFGYTTPLLVRPDSIAIDEEHQWRTLHFGTVESDATAPEGDFDDDGISNLLERALGSNPTVADGVGILPSGRLPDSGVLSGRPSLTFLIPASPHADLTYEIQKSQDLVTWTPIARKIGTGPWSILLASTIIDEGASNNGKIPVGVGAPAVSSSVSLRLFVSASP